MEKKKGSLPFFPLLQLSALSFTFNSRTSAVFFIGKGHHLMCFIMYVVALFSGFHFAFQNSTCILCAARRLLFLLKKHDKV